MNAMKVKDTIQMYLVGVVYDSVLLFLHMLQENVYIIDMQEVIVQWQE